MHTNYDVDRLKIAEIFYGMSKEMCFLCRKRGITLENFVRE